MSNVSVIILGIALAIIMLGMGLSLELRNFKNVIQYPKAVALGLVNQIVLLPILGYALISVLSVSHEVAVGIMILSACPGGASSNLITHLAKGDTALSVSLTAIASIVTVITIPFVVNYSFDLLGVPGSVRLNVVETLTKMFLIVLLPVTIGMVIRKVALGFANKMEKPVKIASASLLMLIIIALMIKERANLGGYFEQAGIAAILLNIGTMSLGYLSAKLFRLSVAQSRSIAIESGIQNGTLALTLIAAFLDNTMYGIAPAIYSILMFFTGGVIIYIAFKQDKSRAQTAH